MCCYGSSISDLPEDDLISLPKFCLENLEGHSRFDRDGYQFLLLDDYGR